jgi:serine/threonine-protein kinase
MKTELLDSNKTQVDHPSAFDVTMDSPAVVPPRSVESAGTSAGRTTVLPRVERTGEAVAVVDGSRPRFETTRALGEGGLGAVVAAKDMDIGREVAIKRLRREVRSPAAVARFVDEIRTVGALEHPNILPIHDVGADDDGSLYFVMPKVRGETLEAILERLQAGDVATHAHWTSERRVHVFRQLLDAVAFAHERGYVHRDIKPANVMIGPYGEVFLMDWGIAKPIGSADHPSTGDGAVKTGRVTETHAGAIIGTPAYMSPEQARGEPVDARSDLYSLCVLFDELLSLRHYLGHCKTVEEMLDGVENTRLPHTSLIGSRHQPPAPAELGWLVVKGTAKDPAHRFQSAREMIDRLEARDEGIIPVQCPVTFTKRATRWGLRLMDRHPGLYVIALTVGALGGIAGVVTHFLR